MILKTLFSLLLAILFISMFFAESKSAYVSYQYSLRKIYVNFNIHL